MSAGSILLLRSASCRCLLASMSSACNRPVPAEHDGKSRPACSRQMGRGHARAISPSTRGTGPRARDAGTLSSCRAPALTLMLACALPAPPAAALPRAGPHAVQPCRPAIAAPRRGARARIERALAARARIERALAARALCADPSAAADGGGRRRTLLSALWTLYLRSRPSAAWAALRCDELGARVAKRAVPLGSTQAVLNGYSRLTADASRRAQMGRRKGREAEADGGRGRGGGHPRGLLRLRGRTECRSPTSRPPS